MVLKPDGFPAAGGTEPGDAVPTIFVARGIIFRALVELEKTPKPWPNSVVKARLLVAQAQGILFDSWRTQSAEIRETTIQKVRDAHADANPVARNSSRRTSRRGERQLEFRDAGVHGFDRDR